MQQKIIWIIFLIIGINISGCDKGEIDSLVKGKYVFINKSNHDIDLTCYENNSLIKSYTINVNDSLVIKQKGMGGVEPFVFDDNTKKADSIKIVFIDPNKCISFIYREGIFDEKNYDNYSNDVVKKSSFTLYYTFTEDMYNNVANICN